MFIVMVEIIEIIGEWLGRGVLSEPHVFHTTLLKKWTDLQYLQTRKKSSKRSRQSDSGSAHARQNAEIHGLSVWQQWRISRIALNLTCQKRDQTSHLTTVVTTSLIWMTVPWSSLVFRGRRLPCLPSQRHELALTGLQKKYGRKNTIPRYPLPGKKEQMRPLLLWLCLDNWNPWHGQGRNLRRVQDWNR